MSLVCGRLPSLVREVAGTWMRCGNTPALGQIMDLHRAGSPSKVRLASTAGCKTLTEVWVYLQGSSGLSRAMY